ncbi:MAG: VWA domain-containing protein [Ruminococcaceae bacterium]|nr:VWA domain-containing protein [Oscillospiraceae bacterium]
MKKTRKIFAILICAIAVLLCACSKQSNSFELFDAGDETIIATDGEATDESYEYTEDIATEDFAADTKEVIGENGNSSQGQSEITAGTLTAGQWNDNLNFDFFKALLQKEEWNKMMTQWNINPTLRYAVDTGVKNAKVVLYDEQGSAIWKAVTDAKGKAYLFYDVFSKSNTKPQKIIAYSSDESVSYTINGNEENNEIKLDLKAQNEKTKKLDLMLTIDTTGSMGDELEYLKKELQSVVSAVASQNSELQIRLSVNFYRDTQDIYVVRAFPFTEDINKAVKNLNAQFSGGGGDTPEAVDEALADSIFGHEWEKESVKIMFLVLDAPAHYERKEVRESLAKSIKEASSMGIRIIPIASSGVDENTEFSLRCLSTLTGGTYTFLTNHSGIGNDHLEPTIGQYNVEKLNELMTKIINEYCA